MTNLIRSTYCVGEEVQMQYRCNRGQFQIIMCDQGIIFLKTPNLPEPVIYTYPEHSNRTKFPQIPESSVYFSHIFNVNKRYIIVTFGGNYSRRILEFIPIKDECIVSDMELKKGDSGCPEKYNRKDINLALKLEEGDKIKILLNYTTGFRYIATSALGVIKDDISIPSDKEILRKANSEAFTFWKGFNQNSPQPQYRYKSIEEIKDYGIISSYMDKYDLMIVINARGMRLWQYDVRMETKGVFVLTKDELDIPESLTSGKLIFALKELKHLPEPI